MYEIKVALSLRPPGTLVKVLKNINKNITHNLNMFLANQTSKSFQAKKNEAWNELTTEIWS